MSTPSSQTTPPTPEQRIGHDGPCGPDRDVPGREPLVVSRFDVAMEPAPEEDQVLTIGAIAEDGRPVALLLDPEARAKVARWLGPDRAEVLREAANALACLGPVDSLTSAPHAWNEAVETLRRIAAEADEPGEVDEMAASLARDGFGPDEIADMQNRGTEDTEAGEPA